MRQQTALQDERRVPLAGVAPGVVHADRRPGHQVLGETQVVGVEGLLAVAPVEAGDAHGDAPGADGHDHRAVQTQVPEGRPLAAGDVRRPGPGPRVEPFGTPGLARGQTADRRRPGAIGGHPADLDHGLRDPGVHRLVPGPPQRHHLVRRVQRLGLRAPQYGVQQVHADEVGEVLHGDVGQFLRGPHDVQAAADLLTGPVQQGQPLPGAVPVGDVDHRVVHAHR